MRETAPAPVVHGARAAQARTRRRGRERALRAVAGPHASDPPDARVRRPVIRRRRGRGDARRDAARAVVRVRRDRRGRRARTPRRTSRGTPSRAAVRARARGSLARRRLRRDDPSSSEKHLRTSLGSECAGARRFSQEEARKSQRPMTVFAFVQTGSPMGWLFSRDSKKNEREQANVPSTF